MRAIAFDLDGTLVNSIPAYRQIAVDVMSKYFNLEPDRARYLYQTTLGHPFEEQLNMCGLNNPKAVREYHERSRDVSVNAELMPGVVEFLKRFDNDAETHIGIVTSSSVIVANKVHQKHFAGQFDWLSGIEMGNKAEQMSQFLISCRLSNYDGIMFGDTEVDREYAKMVGVDFFMISEQQNWPAFIGIHF